MSDFQYSVRNAFEDLCVESRWPVARLTFLGPDNRVTVWSVAPGSEPLRDAWEAGGALASFAARVAAIGRPMLHDLELDLTGLVELARPEGLAWTVAFPIFADAEVIGVVEACAAWTPSVPQLLQMGVRLGSLLAPMQMAA
jgi:hypothetical protein